MKLIPTVPKFLKMLHGAGPGVVIQKALGQLWASKQYFGLRCDLSTGSQLRRAKACVLMGPRDAVRFCGFNEELVGTRGSDCIDVFQRIAMCDAGVENLYCSTGKDGSPAYVQWLITSSTQQSLHSFQPLRYPDLSSNEVLLEGAYTFGKYRGLGIMAEAMGQLLNIARDGGASSALTYVSPDNVRSLRGCAHVGFHLDHVRTSTRRLGFRATRVDTPDYAAREAWNAAVSNVLARPERVSAAQSVDRYI